LEKYDQWNDDEADYVVAGLAKNTSNYRWIKSSPVGEYRRRSK